MITGVIGLTLWTDDLEKMFHFYNETMRLPLHARHDDLSPLSSEGSGSFALILACTARCKECPGTLSA